MESFSASSSKSKSSADAQACWMDEVRRSRISAEGFILFVNCRGTTWMTVKLPIWSNQKRETDIIKIFVLINTFLFLKTVTINFLSFFRVFDLILGLNLAGLFCRMRSFGRFAVEQVDHSEGNDEKDQSQPVE